MKCNNLSVPCISCEHLDKIIDNKDWVHYRCIYAPNIEWLGGFCNDSLNPCCGEYKPKQSPLKTLTKHNR